MKDTVGNLYAIEGMDGSGKRTQTKMTLNVLNSKGVDASFATFPNYNDESSILVKRYLRGAYNNSKPSVCPISFVQQMSLFYTVDRVSTFMSEYYPGRSLIQDYISQKLILCDRYTTSNILHQSANIADVADVDRYIDWVEDLEYNKLSLPRPKKVFYLDIPYQVALDNISKRYEGKDLNDLHENTKHLSDVFNIKDFIIAKCGWVPIQCIDSAGNMRQKEDINEEIVSMILKSL